MTYILFAGADLQAWTLAFNFDEAKDATPSLYFAE